MNFLNSIFVIFVISVNLCKAAEFLNSNSQIKTSIKFNNETVSKLRAFFFPDYYKKFEKPSKPEVICSPNVVLNVNTDKCQCQDYDCSEKKFNYIRRILDTSCDDFCCRKNDTKFIKKLSTRHTENSILSEKARNCGILGNGSIMNRKHINATFPWLAQITTPASQICVGTLIHPRIIMTTAICVFMYSKKELNVRLVSTRNQQQMSHVKEILIHEKFSQNIEKLDYDIALLVLNKPIELSHYMNIMCYDRNNINPFQSLTRQNCYTSSWEFNQTTYSFMQQTEHYYLVPNKICSTAHHNFYRTYDNYFHDGNICATSSKEESKPMTYSGAPLICSTDNFQFVQHGMLTWSTNLNKSPHIFTSIAKFITWIRRKILELKLDYNSIEGSY